ncbi:1,4-alpha-glucan branching protein GlgB [Lachnospiraceae bacterium 38-10]
MQEKLYKLMDWGFIEGIIYSEEDNPHRILGVHRMGANLVFQTFQPGAVSVNVLLREEKKILPMEMVDEAGYFAAMMFYRKIGAYQYEVCYEDGKKVIVEDAYRFLPQISASDTDKLEAGIHYTLYDKLGAHLTEIGGVKGCEFAVWAPNALRVSVVGDFNGWDGRIHQMRRLWDSGIFEIFVPGAKEGDCYKFEMKVKGGLTYLKTDPYAFGTEGGGDFASVICDIGNFEWHDEKWLKERKERQAENAPLNILEVYPGSFAAQGKEGEEAALPLTFREMAGQLIPYVKDMGYTHVAFMPVMEYTPEDPWGYETCAYYAPTSRCGTPADFQYLTDRLHQEGIGVILDWVPGWFPKYNEGLSDFDGTCLYEHLNDKKKNHAFRNVRLYNYGRCEVKNFLIANAMFWVEKYHADGLRVVSVDSMLYLDYGKGEGQWLPNMYGGNENLEAIEFIKHLNSMMKKRNSGVLMIAEEYSAWAGVTGELKKDGLGFDYKWNTDWTKDYLEYIKYDPYFRAHHQEELTLSMVYAYSEKYILPFSHEIMSEASLYQRIPGKEESKLAGLRLTYAYHMTHPGKKLLFMGQEIGERESWQTDRGIDWTILQEEGHEGLQNMVRELNRFYLAHPALYQEDYKSSGFQWVDCIDHENCKLTFIRKAGKAKTGVEELFVVCNFAGVDREVQIGVPHAGKYKEIFNTDDVRYGGEGYINPRMKKAAEKKADGCEQSIKVKMAALSVSIWQVTV